MKKNDMKILINCLKIIYDIMGSFNDMLDFLMSICIDKKFDNETLVKVLQDALDKVVKLSNELSSYILGIKERVDGNREFYDDDLIMLNIFDSIHDNLSKSIEVIRDCIAYSILENDLDIDLELHETYESLAEIVEDAKRNNTKDEIFNNLIDEIKCLLTDFDNLFNDISRELDK